MRGDNKQDNTNQHLVLGPRNFNIHPASNQRELWPQLTHQLVWSTQSQSLN